MKRRSPFSHVRLPEKTDRLLFILCEDLKNNFVFNGLEKVGFDAMSSRSHFTFVVLESIFHEVPDELATLYLELLEKYSRKIKDFQRDSIIKQALRMYVDLMIEKKRRSG